MKVLELRKKIAKLQEELKEHLDKGFNDGDTYYYINSRGKVCVSEWSGRDADIERSQFGNIYKSNMEATIAGEVVRNLLRGTIIN